MLGDLSVSIYGNCALTLKLKRAIGIEDRKKKKRIGWKAVFSLVFSHPSLFRLRRTARALTHSRKKRNALLLAASTVIF